MSTDSAPENNVVLETRNLDIFYGDFLAVTGVNIKIPRHKITAIIGPSGCGKTTLLRAFNRMNELVPGTYIRGEVVFDGQNLYEKTVDPVEVRFRIGMVFQKANPFPKSIYENVAWGARIHGYKGDMDELSNRPCARLPYGMRSKTYSNSPACRSPAASSSVCASRVPSPCSRRSS